MYIKIDAQGHLFKASVKGHRRRGGGRRSKITRFSASSRKRLFELVTRLEVGDVLFGTFTYKVVVPPWVVKADIDRFGKLLIKTFPGLAMVWRFGLESEGERVYNPHVHTLFFNMKFISHDVLERLWSRATGGRGGWVWIKLEGWRRALGYCARYLGHVEAVSLEDIAYLTGQRWVGRFWGVIGRKNLPFGVAVGLTFAIGGWFFKLKRAARHYWRGVNTRSYHGFTLFCDCPVEWIRLAVYLGG